MKKYLYSIAVSLLCAIVFIGCDKENVFGAEDGITGQLSIAKLVPEIRSGEQVKEKQMRSGVDINQFYIRILSGSEVVREGLFAEMPEVIDLAPNDYTIKVSSSRDAAVADWESPYYEGQQNFTISAGEITEVKTIVCKLANVKVSIIYDDELKAVMGDDCKVNVVVGSEGNLDFGRDETRSGYFAFIEGSSTLAATFTGTVDGVREENFRTYVDVVPGSHYKITYSLHSTNIDVPQPEGSLVPGVVVDAVVSRVDLTVDVNLDDDLLEDDWRPSQGDDNPNPPTPDTPDTPTKQAPSLTPTELFDSPQTVTASSEVKFRAESTAEGGFKEFTVIIDSKVLNADELESVGLTDRLDLVNPGEFADKLSGFGFPVYVGGKADADFDLSQFMGLLELLGTATHSFKIHVADANGTTDKTLTLVIK